MNGSSRFRSLSERNRTSGVTTKSGSVPTLLLALAVTHFFIGIRRKITGRIACSPTCCLSPGKTGDKTPDRRRVSLASEGSISRRGPHANGCRCRRTGDERFTADAAQSKPRARFSREALARNAERKNTREKRGPAAGRHEARRR